MRGVGASHVYVDDDAVDRWIKALDLRPAEEGANVVLRVPADPDVFYHPQRVHGVTLVGTIQLYLDLARDPGRGREQADFLRKERLEF